MDEIVDYLVANAEQHGKQDQEEGPDSTAPEASPDDRGKSGRESSEAADKLRTLLHDEVVLRALVRLVTGK